MEGLVTAGHCKAAFGVFQRMKTWVSWSPGVWKRGVVGCIEFWIFWGKSFFPSSREVHEKCHSISVRCFLIESHVSSFFLIENQFDIPFHHVFLINHSCSPSAKNHQLIRAAKWLGPRSAWPESSREIKVGVSHVFFLAELKSHFWWFWC